MCSLAVLDIPNNGIDDTNAALLSTTLCVNSSLRALFLVLFHSSPNFPPPPRFSVFSRFLPTPLPTAHAALHQKFYSDV